MQSKFLTCKKKFSGFPFAHRQPDHDGHCRLIHGHNWRFKFVFGCREVDPATGFVVDFGKLAWIREWLKDNFDHTLVLNIEDPALGWIKETLQNAKGVSFPVISGPFAKIICVPNCSCEGLAQWIWDEVSGKLSDMCRGVHLVSVEVQEDSNNSATFKPERPCGHA